MFSDVSPIFVIFSTSFIMHSAALQDSTPGKMLHQYSNLVRADKILVSDKDQVQAVCWFFKRNDVYSLAGRGELMYGLKYNDSKSLLLTIDRFNTLVKRYFGRIAAVFNFQNFQNHYFWNPTLKTYPTSCQNMVLYLQNINYSMTLWYQRG